jgi:hypothetical protein
MKVQHDLIRLRAYEIWARSGYPDGQHNEHWEQAEKELLGEAPEGEASAGVEPSTDAGAAADGEISEAKVAPVSSRPEPTGREQSLKAAKRS